MLRSGRACLRSRNRCRYLIRDIFASDTAYEHSNPVIALLVAFGAKDVIGVFACLIFGTYQKGVSELFCTLAFSVLSTDTCPFDVYSAEVLTARLFVRSPLNLFSYRCYKACSQCRSTQVAALAERSSVSSSPRSYGLFWSVRTNISSQDTSLIMMYHVPDIQPCSQDC